ncbi:hypothetical protein N310_13859, partial [Acanthisitta chloris]
VPAGSLLVLLSSAGTALAFPSGTALAFPSGTAEPSASAPGAFGLSGEGVGPGPSEGFLATGGGILPGFFWVCALP